MKIFGREPAVIIGTVQATLISLVMLTPWTPEVQGVVSGAIAVVGGCVLAFTVAAEKGLALLGGVAQAVFAVTLAFGQVIPDNVQQTVLTLISIGVGFLVRAGVDAPVPREATVLPYQRRAA